MPVITWMVLIFAGSSDVLSSEHTSRFLVPFLLWLDPSMSFHTIESIHLVFRKLGHVTEYAVLAGLLWRAFRGSFPLLPRRMMAVTAFLIAAGFAASDEYHQSFVPSRTSTTHDVVIDCLGAALAVLICVILSRPRAVTVTDRV
ncbi:MAG TPA: VanZ family protein [Chthoniobacterales bacterium]